MPSDANLQEPGGDDEPFGPDTGTDFEHSAYSDVLDRGFANICTPVISHAERHAQPEAPRKQSGESAAKHKHQHSKTKRAFRHSATKSKTLATFPPKSPEKTTPAPARRTPPATQVPVRNTQRRKAADRADASRRATREERTPPDWSDEGETERPRLSSPARRASPAEVVGGRELLFDSSSPSSELSDVYSTVSRRRPRRSHTAKEQRQPLRGHSPRPKASATSIAASEGAAGEEKEELPRMVTVPEWRQAIAKRTDRKVQIPQMNKAKQLASRVDAIWTDLDHGKKDNFDPDGFRVVQHVMSAYNYLHVHGSDLLRDVRLMFAEVEWKVLADFPGVLFKTNRICIATSAERATYNLLNNLPEDVVPVERLKEKAGTDIGECTDYLEASPETLLTLRDIWTRLLRKLDYLYDFERRILELEGRGPTAIMTTGLPNASAVFKLINEYLQAPAGRSGRIRHIELADGSMQKLAALARRAVTWHLGFEDLVLIALDIENKKQSAMLVEKQPSRGSPDLQHYLGRPKYDSAEDIALVQSCCNDDVKRKLRSFKLTTALGGVVTRWKTDDRT